MAIFIIIGFVVILLCAVVFMVVRGGTKGGRHNQSGRSAVNEQQDKSGGRGRPVV